MDRLFRVVRSLPAEPERGSAAAGARYGKIRPQLVNQGFNHLQTERPGAFQAKIRRQANAIVGYREFDPIALRLPERHPDYTLAAVAKGVLQ